MRDLLRGQHYEGSGMLNCNQDPNKHSLCLQSEGSWVKICMLSNTLRWKCE